MARHIHDVTLEPENYTTPRDVTNLQRAKTVTTPPRQSALSTCPNPSAPMWITPRGSPNY